VLCLCSDSSNTGSNATQCAGRSLHDYCYSKRYPGYCCATQLTPHTHYVTATADCYYTGTYSTLPSLAQLSECTDCPQGSACPGTAAISVSACAAGYYCPTKTGSPTSNPCPAGTYSSSTSLYSVQQCIVCPAGSYCAQVNTTMCTLCFFRVSISAACLLVVVEVVPL
jgi:hypothetical protein